MNRVSALFMALAIGLAGCSELTTKDAPIEDRSVTPASAAGNAATADAKTAGQASAATNAATATTGAATSQGAQTQGTSAQGVEVHPLPAGQGGQGGGAMNGSAMPQGAQYATMRVPPKDPASPLAKRVIHFDYDSSVIKDEYRDLLKAHAEFLKNAKEARSVLQGHTDERGSRDYNLALGQRRAESVNQALVLLGVEAQKLESVSLGEEKPLKEGHDEPAWAENRRVEIYYQGE
jgi:peptidoglycan-associated lipoprotein